MGDLSDVSDAAILDRVEGYVRWLLDALVDHEHLLAAREDVDPNDDFECPMCAFTLGITDDLDNTDYDTDMFPEIQALVEFARTHPEMEMLSADDRRELIRDARPWVHSILNTPIRPWRTLAVPEQVMGVAMGKAIRAALDKTNTAADALHHLWSGWTVHRTVSGKRRNTTCVISRDGYVGLVRMQSWDYWAYTVRDVPAVAWEAKTFEERLSILIDSVHTVLITTDVKALIEGAGGGMVTTKGIGYAGNVRAMCVREIKAAFPTGQIPPA